jgi:multiple sugar transport system substrate-binding protein
VQNAPTRTRRKLFAHTATPGLAAIFLASCGAPGGSEATGTGGTKKPVKIAYWGKWTGANEEPENLVIANFQQKFSHITVDGLDSNQVAGEGALDREKFIAALAAGNPPDVIKIDRFKMGGHGAKGATMVMDDLVKRDRVDMKKFYPATVEEVMFPPGSGGKITALPWNTDDRALIYNKKHFMEVGIDPNKPPRTWEEVMDVGTKLTKMEGGRLVRAGYVAWGANTNWSIGTQWAAGGQWLKAGPDGKPNRKAAFNDARGRQALQHVKDNLERHLGGFQAYEEWRTRWGPREQGAWFNDGISMGVHGSWMIGDFKRFGPHVDWGVVPAPRPRGMEGTPTTWAGGFALAIPTGIKGDQLAAAWEFVKYYCYGKDAQLLFGSRTGQMPALLEAAEDKAFKESDPHMPVFVEVMKHAKIRDVTPAGDEIWFNDQARTRQFAMFELGPRTLEGKMSISDILNESEKHVNLTLDEAWARAGR